MKVSIIGAGIVGTATGKGLTRHGHEIIFYDISGGRLEQLAQEGCQVADSYKTLIDCQIHFICVPTPAFNGHMDSGVIEEVLIKLAGILPLAVKFPVIAIRSTLLPLFMQDRLIPLLERSCRLKAGQKFCVCCNPEFLRELSAEGDFLNPPAIVLGTNDPQTEAIMRQLYTNFTAPLILTSPENAAAIKLFSNLYNATKISFFNEMYLIAENLGLDNKIISRALTRTSLGISIPEYYTRGGYPFGGFCLPKDLIASISFFKEQGIDIRLLEATWQVNEAMKRLPYQKQNSDGGPYDYHSAARKHAGKLLQRLKLIWTAFTG